MAIVQDLQGNVRIVYSDVNSEVNLSDNSELVFNENSINQSILTILDTKRGTRVFRRDFGSNMADLVFLPMTETTLARIYREMVRAIEIWETRVEIITAEIIPDYPNQQWFIELNYRIPTLNNKTAVFNFNISRGN